jgi:hypothetical protein
MPSRAFSQGSHRTDVIKFEKDNHNELLLVEQYNVAHEDSDRLDLP